MREEELPVVLDIEGEGRVRMTLSQFRVRFGRQYPPGWASLHGLVSSVSKADRIAKRKASRAARKKNRK